MKKQYNCNKKYYFSFLLLFIILFISCSKDENEDLQREWKGNIELPALRNGANDIFLSPTTTFSGEKVITYSMEYDKSKKHARWIAFKYYNVTGQTVMTGNKQNGVVILGNLIREFLSLINGHKVTLVNKVMFVVIFVLLQTVFIRKTLMNKLSIILT